MRSAFPLQDDDGRLNGPFGPMLLAPAMGDALQQLGAVIRFESRLDPVARELVILAVAAVRRSEFEWFAHAAVARSLDVDESVLGALLDDDFTQLDAAHRCAVQLARSIAAGTAPAPAARVELGDEVFFEVVVTAGYYAMLADLLGGFGVGLPAGVQAVFGPESA